MVSYFFDLDKLIHRLSFLGASPHRRAIPGFVLTGR